MRLFSENTWLAIAAASAVAAGVSAAAAAFSYSDGNSVVMMISVVSFAVLAVCSITAWTLRSKVPELKEEEEEEIVFLRLKKPGTEEHEEEIVPKGKMPKER